MRVLKWLAGIVVVVTFVGWIFGIWEGKVTASILFIAVAWMLLRAVDDLSDERRERIAREVKSLDLLREIRDQLLRLSSRN
jgi:hypothetical protein